MCTLKFFKASKRSLQLISTTLTGNHFVGHSHYQHFAVPSECTFILGYEDLCVGGTVVLIESHPAGLLWVQTASGISMYKQAYKWSTIWLFIFILLTVNKAEQALTPSNKWRPMHANSAAAGNRGGLFELRSILFRLHWS